MEPHMTRHERSLFYKYLDKARYYEEFGAGGSTVVAVARPNIVKVHTVESNSDWIDKLRHRSDISSAISNNKLELVHANIGKTRRWGMPKGGSSRERWPNYSGKYAETGDKFDLILVDGRFRVACALKALQRILPEDRDNTTLIVHDYVNRTQYHRIEEFATVVDQVDTLAVFRKKADVDSLQLAQAIAFFDKVTD
eukprot:gnl/TRDRNA2_/TRDRNA2_163843_c0_seq4.p1 gnl/TRDRNA2_/TRDRNA2_163843_c0~~gnl/TRDRNA2_/TRDRNA2_163843_c0_seq4.p1  ORF type:complete len:230 (-),score=25.12 gnl/TRDRNA2_/TRDRNA2_163843_c0_seq4:40-627(-)